MTLNVIASVVTTNSNSSLTLLCYWTKSVLTAYDICHDIIKAWLCQFYVAFIFAFIKSLRFRFASITWMHGNLSLLPTDFLCYHQSTKTQQYQWHWLCNCYKNLLLIVYYYWFLWILLLTVIIFMNIIIICYHYCYLLISSFIIVV